MAIDSWFGRFLLGQDTTTPSEKAVIRSLVAQASYYAGMSSREGSAQLWNAIRTSLVGHERPSSLAGAIANEKTGVRDVLQSVIAKYQKSGKEAPAELIPSQRAAAVETGLHPIDYNTWIQRLSYEPGVIAGLPGASAIDVLKAAHDAMEDHLKTSQFDRKVSLVDVRLIGDRTRGNPKGPLTLLVQYRALVTTGIDEDALSKALSQGIEVFGLPLQVTLTRDDTTGTAVEWLHRNQSDEPLSDVILPDIVGTFGFDVANAFHLTPEGDGGGWRDGPFTSIVRENKAEYGKDESLPKERAIDDPVNLARPVARAIARYRKELVAEQKLRAKVEQQLGVINAIKVNEQEFLQIINSLGLEAADVDVMMRAFASIGKRDDIDAVWNAINKVYTSAMSLSAKHMTLESEAKEAAKLQAEKVAAYVLQANHDAARKAYLQFLDDMHVPASIFRTPQSIIRAFDNIKGAGSLAAAERWVQERIDEAERKELIDAIGDLRERIRSSKTIAVDYKERALALADSIELSGHPEAYIQRIFAMAQAIEAKQARGEDVTLSQRHKRELELLSRKPVNAFTTEELGELYDTINSLAGWGILKQKLRKQAYEHEVANIAQDLSITVKRQDEAARASVDAKRYIETGDGNGSRLLDARDFVKRLWLGAKPAWMMADILGVPQIKKALDKSFDTYLNTKDYYRAQLRNIADKYHLNARSMRRIGVLMHAADQDGRGVLDEWGITDAQVKEIRDSLTEGERAYMAKARAILDELYPKLDQSMQREFNVRVGHTDNYFPRMKNWDVIDNLDIKERFGQLYDADTGKPIVNEVPATTKKNVKVGETEHRVAKRNRAELNASRVLEQYIDDVAYQLSMTHTIRVHKDAIDQTPVKENLGAIGYQVLSEYLAMLARKGGTIAGRSIPMLDAVRRNTGAFMLAWKLPSALVQFTQYTDVIATIGPHWAMVGLEHFLFSPEWRQMVRRESPKIRDMIGDDPSYKDLQENWWTRAGTAPLQRFDMVTRIAGFIGAYEQYCSVNGIEANPEDVNPDAALFAQETVGDILASPFPVDMPTTLSTGYGLSNKSLARTILQYQNPMLFRAANIEDKVIGGFKRKDYKGALWAMLVMVLFGAIAESGVRRGSKKLLGGKNTETFWKDVVDNIVGGIPYIGQLWSALQYGNNPVPLIAMIGDAFTYASRFNSGKTFGAKMKAMIYLVGTGLGLAGLFPGGSEILQIMRYNFLDTDTLNRWKGTWSTAPGVPPGDDTRILEPGASTQDNRVTAPGQQTDTRIIPPAQ
jgi:hypothetical protein